MTLRRRILLGIVLSLTVIAAGQRDVRPAAPAPAPTPAPEAPGRRCAEDEPMGTREPWCVHVEQIIGLLPGGPL